MEQHNLGKIIQTSKNIENITGYTLKLEGNTLIF